MKHIYLLIGIILLAGCIEESQTIVVTLPPEPSSDTSSPAITTIAPTSTISLEELQTRYWGLTTSTTSTTSTSTSTTTTFKLKQQGSFSQQQNAYNQRHPTTTTTTTLPEIPAYMTACTEDNDCGLAQDCCGCDFGGNVYPMNKMYVKIWEHRLACSLHIQCGWMRKPCWYRAECVNETCQKTLESKEAE